MPRAIYDGRKFPTFTFESISTLTAAGRGRQSWGPPHVRRCDALRKELMAMVAE